MEVNVKSMMLSGKYSVPVMASGGGGAIVNISSISAIRPRAVSNKHLPLPTNREI